MSAAGVRTQRTAQGLQLREAGTGAVFDLELGDRDAVAFRMAYGVLASAPDGPARERALALASSDEGAGRDLLLALALTAGLEALRPAPRAVGLADPDVDWEQVSDVVNVALRLEGQARSLYVIAAWEGERPLVELTLALLDGVEQLGEIEAEDEAQP